MKTNFEIWRDSDNVVGTSENGYRTQCSQYTKVFTESELKAYFIREYAENSKEYADEIADLFNHYNDLPLKIKEIINVFNTEIDVTENGYDLCKKLVSELEIHGYTCEYGLDFQPYNLQKLETTNETPEEMKTENIVFEHENKQVVKKGNHFFTRITENGESFESADFNTLERAKESLGIEPTTEEKNKLIALFMGLSYCEKYTFEGWYKNHEHNERICDFNGLKYHSNWNDLMEVIKKISNTDYVTDFFINALTGYTTIETYSETEEGKNKVFSGFGEGIKGTYDAVVEFIKWHNQQNT